MFIYSQSARARTRLNALISGLAILLMAQAACASAHAEPKFPTRPVRLILPFGAGGVADLTMRLLAQKLERDVPASSSSSRTGPGAGGSSPSRRARLAARRLLADADRQRHGDQHVAVQVAALRRADGLHARLGHGHVRYAARDQGAMRPFKTVADVIDYAQEEPGQAQSRRDQSRQHAEPVGASVQADDRRSRSPSSRSAPRPSSSPACCAATSTWLRLSTPAFKARSDDKQFRIVASSGESAIPCCRMCRP